MQRKKLSFLALVALATLGLASCKEEVIEEEKNPGYEYGGKVNVYLNYNGQNGISYQETDPYYNRVDKITYTRGDLLPTWSAFSKNCNLDIKDVASYSEKKDDDVYKVVEAKNFTGTDGSNIDLFYNSVGNIKKMASNGTALDLLPYLQAGKMPHFKAYLDKNPEVLEMCVLYDDDGKQHLYYTPYFDGYQQIERMFIMDTEMVERLLDKADVGDITPAIGENKLGGAYYKPFMDATNNYKDATTAVKSLDDNDNVIDVNVVQTTNIIKQQNELLANPATTGKDMLVQLQAYLKKAYPTYTKLSDIYTGAKAIYNPDDLVALMRAVRANPATATGVATCGEVVVFFPRGVAANRMENVYDLAAIWGVNGVDSETNNLFFDGAGKLNVIGGMQQNYDALVLLNQLYNEGLIQKEFYNAQGISGGTYYLDKYYKNTSSDSGAGFMMYDYCASTTVGNTVDKNGIGTSTGLRKGVYAQQSRVGIRPVLSPVTYWNTSYESKNTDTLIDATGQAVDRVKKTLTRFSDSNRSLKPNSWCVPTNSSNKDGAIRLMDYLYSQEGSDINDFGPAEYQGPKSTEIIFGETVPTLSDTLVLMYLSAPNGEDFWTFMRKYIGSTNGIGSVRSDALDMQVTNQYAAVGLANVQKAIKKGIMHLAKCTTKENYNWNACVPTNWQVSENSTLAPSYKSVNDFWRASDTGLSGWRAIVAQAPNTDLNKVSVDANLAYENVLALRDTYNMNYLSVWSESINATPSWLKELLQAK